MIMKEEEKSRLLKDITLFNNIALEEIDFLKSKFSLSKYHQDDIILNGSAFEQKSCYFLRSGRVRVVRTVPNNHDVSYYDLEAPLGFGFENLYPETYDNQKQDKAIVSAVSDVELFSISQVHLEEILQDQRILLNFTQYLLGAHRKLLSPPASPLINFRKTA